jgi:hypothetical protein
MINLQTLKVKIQNVDIAPMVLSLTMFETIKGNARGSLTVQDNVNFMDTFIPSSAHAPIQIQWQYMGYMFTNEFYVDGIEKMEIIKTGKKYQMHFLAYTTMNSQLKKINGAYSGRGDEIIHKIYRETNPVLKNSTFFRDSRSITKGRYVVPNIKSAEALTSVVNSCYDVNKSPLFMYQRIADEGGTRLTSLFDMDKNEFGIQELTGVMTHTQRFTLKASLAGTTEESDGLDVRDEIGTVSQFVMDEFNTHYTSKLASGFYGSKIQQIGLDETSTKDLPPAELTDVALTSFKLQNSLYDDDIKSVFSTMCEPEAHAAHNQKRRVFNVRMNAMGTVAVPGLSCGFSIATDSGGSNRSKSKTDSKYIISSIQHRFTMEDGDFAYAQDISLIRDGTGDL